MMISARLALDGGRAVFDNFFSQTNCIVIVQDDSRAGNVVVEELAVVVEELVVAERELVVAERELAVAKRELQVVF